MAEERRSKTGKKAVEQVILAGEDARDQACHREQETDNSCVAAARTFGWKRQFLQFDRPEDREMLLGYLALGMRVIVDVYPGHLTMLSERRGLVSRHGHLMERSPEDRERREDLTARVRQLPHHAIVLVRLGDGIIRYLDPWFPGAGQPLWMSFEDFFRMWTGQVLIPSRTSGASWT